MGVHRVGDLEVDEDLKFQRRAWRVQRGAWVVMTILLLAALVGLFGGAGPLAQARAGNEDQGLEINYRRLTRKRAPTELQISLQPEAVHGEQVSFWLDRAFVEGFEIVDIVPEPERVQIDDERVTYAFAAGSVSESVTVTFNIEWQTIGLSHGQIGLDDGSTVDLDVFVYP